ncbi:MAG TPA: [Fe-Fe] hydrogenase large subunit C-terminal domain-containing protein, partial [bacterium]|nr:[Fe-Fe] hydrogenase large subunit C-terminal domain-containing protein [bacterium]
LGFAEVWSVAFGAELVSKAYAELIEDSRKTGKTFIATPCPAVVAYIEKYMPTLHDLLAPIVSPMIATARAIRQKHGDKVKVVFIGPCIAKKEEILDPCLGGDVDDVLTFREMEIMLQEKGIVLSQAALSDFDGPKSFLGRSFPISGGLLKTACIGTDILDNDLVTTEGKDRVLAVLDELAEGRPSARFFDLLFCEGCINGPRMLNDRGILERKELLARFVREQSKQISLESFQKSLEEYAGVDVHRDFLHEHIPLILPSEEDITEALVQMRKLTSADHLNCGACGYPTCRENAIAVCQGIAEPGMCLPYLVEELEDLLGELQQSNQELASTQQKLVQTERLASMGQLSAGVAHELNNPLGTVLIYSHMILRHLSQDDPRREDLQMIVSEANRCKTIVRGLLDFARQSRVSKAPAQLTALISEVVAIMTSRADNASVRIAWDHLSSLPAMIIDAAQIKQVLVNLVGNAIDATPPGGTVTITARPIQGDSTIEISVSDTGQGIPAEHLDKLFTPFFTTKELGKGT